MGVLEVLCQNLVNGQVGNVKDLFQQARDEGGVNSKEVL